MDRDILIEMLLWILLCSGVLIFIFFLIGIVLLNDVGGSRGKHIGIVTAIEFNKNILWDANIVYFKTSEESTQEDKYCVNDLELKTQLEQLARKRELVTIEFKNNFWFWRWKCNGGSSIIVGISP